MLRLLYAATRAAIKLDIVLDVFQGYTERRVYKIVMVILVYFLSLVNGGTIRLSKV